MLTLSSNLSVDAFDSNPIFFPFPHLSLSFLGLFLFLLLAKKKKCKFNAEGKTAAGPSYCNERNLRNMSWQKRHYSVTVRQQIENSHEITNLLSPSE